MTTLLVAFDDVRSAIVLARLLRSDGYAAEGASTAAAVEQLTRGPCPDAVIGELTLPLPPALTLARCARAHCGAIPIVVVTAYPHSCDAARVEIGEPFVILTKPLDYARLLASLHAAFTPRATVA